MRKEVLIKKIEDVFREIELCGEIYKDKYWKEFEVFQKMVELNEVINKKENK